MAQLIDAAIVVALLTATVFLIYFLFVLRDVREFLGTAKQLSEKLQAAIEQVQPRIEETLTQAQQFFHRSDQLIDRIERDVQHVEQVLQEGAKIQQSLQELNSVMRKNIIMPLREVGIVLNAAVKAVKVFLQFLFRSKS